MSRHLFFLHSSTPFVLPYVLDYFRFFPKHHCFLCYSMVFTFFPPYFQVVSKLFPNYFQNLTLSYIYIYFHGFRLIAHLIFSMVSTLFPPNCQVISKLFLAYFQNLTLSHILPWFSPCFGLISKLFPGYFRIIFKILLFPYMFALFSTLFPNHFQICWIRFPIHGCFPLSNQS